MSEGSLFWQRGDTVPARYVWRDKVMFAGQDIVVEDGPDRTLLFTPMGSIIQRTTIDYATGTIGEPAPHVWTRTHNLRFLEPGSGTCISAMYRGDNGDFICWYIDVIEPVRRAGGGVVLWDLALDIVVAPDLTWKMKDEDHFAQMQARGWITPERVEQVRRDVASVIERIERRTAPFNEPWPAWRPDPSWPIPVLPDNWAVVPE